MLAENRDNIGRDDCLVRYVRMGIIQIDAVTDLFHGTEIQRQITNRGRGRNLNFQVGMFDQNKQRLSNSSINEASPQYAN